MCRINPYGRQVQACFVQRLFRYDKETYRVAPASYRLTHADEFIQLHTHGPVIRTGRCISEDHMETYFAPAQRESREEVLYEYGALSDNLVFKEVIDTMPQIFMVLNDCRQIVYGNRAVLEFLNTVPEAVLGKRPGEALSCVQGLSAKNGCGTGEACAKCGAVDAILRSQKGEEVLNECRIRVKGGEAFNLQVWTYPMYVQGKDYVIMIATDISDAKRRQSLERIFFHDVLNTAGGIYGYLKKMSVESSVQMDKSRKTVETLCSLTSRLIDEIKCQKQILAAEQNQLAIHPDIVDSVEIIGEVMELYRNHEVCIDKTIAIHDDSERVRFKSDGILLHRILGNMVKNALEASHPGDTVTVQCWLTDEKVNFSVHNPTFIPHDAQLQIFQRSFSTKGEGRGLGTYSMKLLSKRYLKGDVTFITAEKGGTVFTASYPYVKADEVKDEEPMYAGVKSDVPCRVLLVEDNEINREIAKFFLEEDGCIVAEAETGEEALGILEDKKFDLVLMDINMPGMGGIEAFKSIRQNIDIDIMPVIAMTAEEADDWAAFGENFGMDDYVCKPFEPDQVLSKIHKWMGRGQRLN